MSKPDKSRAFRIPVPNATLVALSPDAKSVLSYHSPFLHLHNRSTPKHHFWWKASWRVTSVTAVSLNEGAFFGTRHGSVFFASPALEPRLVATLQGTILAVSHTRTYLAVATPSCVFVIRGKKVVRRFNEACVSALALAEWHAIGETARSASLAFIADGKVTYIPDLSDGCVGVKYVESARFVYLHQGPSKDYLYVLGNRLRVYEAKMNGKLHRSESFQVTGLTCAEWIREKGGRVIVTASIERGMIQIMTSRISKHVRFE